MAYAVNCHPKCSLNHLRLGAQRAADVQTQFEKGVPPAGIKRELIALGIPVSDRSLYRHFKTHVTVIPGTSEEDEAIVETFEKPDLRLSDLEILERIIQKGAAALSKKDVRVTPEMTMKALDLKLKLTQGSVFDAFLGAVAEAMEDAPPVDETDPDG